VNRIVVVGGSIAAATAAATLRADGYKGDVVMVSEELVPPYSRVSLSKGVLAGTHSLDSTLLPALPNDIELRLGVKAVYLDSQTARVGLSSGEILGFDGLVIATGARARRLTEPARTGEYVLRTQDDAMLLANRLSGSRSAVVVGGGFLGMEVASTLLNHGLEVTVVDRDPPLERLLGRWLADLIVAKAKTLGTRFAVAPAGVELVGDPVDRVRWNGGDSVVCGDLIVSAAGDLANIEWLQGSGLALADGVVVDDRGLAASGIAAAGDVAAREIGHGVFRRIPHWTNAVRQGQAAARALLDPSVGPFQPEHYFWTEQFGLEIKIAGKLPLRGDPRVVDGSLEECSVLLQWSDTRGDVAAVSVNQRIPVARLKSLAGSISSPA
jgi:3-phenylpropionate/trans-cinnamate dioxygenase ferredoxin reductase component